jgi:hypothetical protein
MGMFLTTLAGVAVLDTQDSEFKVGQVWKCNTRPNEPDSTITICKVEACGTLGTVIHVSINDVKIKKRRNKDGHATKISHLPFAELAIKQSVTQLAQEKVTLPNLSEGYQPWRKAAEAGKAGIWTVTVDEAVAAMEKAMNK